MSDHKAEAEKNIDAGYVEVADDAELAVSLTLAQVHATLYLAEQQRIANLIAAAALVPAGGKSGIDSWGIESDAVLHSRLADQDTWELLLGANVAKREGLA